MRCSPRRAKASGRAFTLIELLVVISIIALLVGLLLPALGEARTVALSARCLANQHQIGIGMANYEADYQGALPGLQQEVDEGPAGFWIGPSELGVQPDILCPANYGPDSAKLGWSGGSCIYATFNPGIDGCDPWDIGNNGMNYAGFYGSVYDNLYSSPSGIGYIGPYISPTGSIDATDGRLFYCPGTTASFGPMGDTGRLFGLSPYYNVYGVRTLVSNGVYASFLTDWNKKPGQGGAGSSGYFNVGNGCAVPANPMAFGTYYYRSGEYYDTANATGHAVTNGVADDWHTKINNKSNLHDGYFKSDAPFLEGKCYLVCDSPIMDYGGTFGLGALGNVCHAGKSVNRAFHDGSARTFAIPLGHLPPYSEAFGTGLTYINREGFGPTTFNENGLSGPISSNYEWPYYWVILDGAAPYPNN